MYECLTTQVIVAKAAVDGVTLRGVGIIVELPRTKETLLDSMTALQGAEGLYIYRFQVPTGDIYRFRLSYSFDAYSKACTVDYAIRQVADGGICEKHYKGHNGELHLGEADYLALLSEGQCACSDDDRRTVGGLHGDTWGRASEAEKKGRHDAGEAALSMRIVETGAIATGAMATETMATGAMAAGSGFNSCVGDNEVERFFGGSLSWRRFEPGQLLGLSEFKDEPNMADLPDVPDSDLDGFRRGLFSTADFACGGEPSDYVQTNVHHKKPKVKVTPEPSSDRSIEKSRAPASSRDKASLSKDSLEMGGDKARRGTLHPSEADEPWGASDRAGDTNDIDVFERCKRSFLKADSKANILFAVLGDRQTYFLPSGDERMRHALSSSLSQSLSADLVSDLIRLVDKNKSFAAAGICGDGLTDSASSVTELLTSEETQSDTSFPEQPDLLPVQSFDDEFSTIEFDSLIQDYFPADAKSAPVGIFNSHSVTEYDEITLSSGHTSPSPATPAGTSFTTAEPPTCLVVLPPAQAAIPEVRVKFWKRTKRTFIRIFQRLRNFFRGRGRCRPEDAHPYMEGVQGLLPLVT